MGMGMDDPRRKPPGAPNDKQADQADSQLPLWPPEPSSPSPDSGPSPAAGSTADPPWALADLGAFIAFAVFSFLFVNLIAAALFSFLRSRLGWEMTIEEVFTEAPFVVSIQAGWEFLWFLFIYFTITMKYRRRFWQALRWKPGPQRRNFYLMAGVGLAFLAQLLFYFFPSEERLPIERLFTSVESAYLLAFFGVCVAPFVEELVFRGFFYPVFEKRWGLEAAVFLTAVMFAAIHVPQLRGGGPEIAAIFIVGAAFSYCRGKTGSLLPPFLMHLSYNACLFVSMYLSTDGFRELGG